MSLVQNYVPQESLFLQHSSATTTIRAFANSMSSFKPPAPEPSSSAGQHSFRRTFNGCVRCKQRHVKCDQSKPTCTRCLRRGDVCEYLAPRMRLFDPQTTKDSKSSSPSHSPSSTSSSLAVLPSNTHSHVDSNQELESRVRRHFDRRVEWLSVCNSGAAMVASVDRYMQHYASDPGFHHMFNAGVQVEDSYSDPIKASDPTIKAAYFESIDKALVEIRSPRSTDSANSRVLYYLRGFVGTEVRRTLDLAAVGPWLTVIEKSLSDPNNTAALAPQVIEEFWSWLHLVKKAHLLELIIQGKASQQAVQAFDATYFGYKGAELDSIASLGYEVDVGALEVSPPSGYSSGLHALTSMLLQFKCAWVARFLTRANTLSGWREQDQPHITLMTELSFWAQRYTGFVAAEPLSLQDSVLLRLLHIHQRTMTAVASALQATTPGEDETIAMAFGVEAMSSLITDCEQFVFQARSVPDLPLEKCPGFGIIPPLFFLATKCPLVDIRKRALGLLENVNVYENGWHSRIAFHVANVLHTIETAVEASGPVTHNRRSSAYLINVACAPNDTIEVAELTVKYAVNGILGPGYEHKVVLLRGDDYDICRELQWPLDDTVETFGYAPFSKPELTRFRTSSTLQVHFCDGNCRNCKVFYDDFCRRFPLSHAVEQSATTF